MRASFPIFIFTTRLVVIVLIACCGRPSRMVFGKSILQSGREGLLVAPDARFQQELKNQRLIPHHADEDSSAPAIESEEMEFEKAMWSATNTTAAVAQYKTVREQISRLRDATEAEKEKPWVEVNIEGAPAEFTQYLKAAVLWHNGEKEAACKLWKDLLELPIGERHYRSVWAAYMLGRGQVDGDYSLAHENFELVRRLVSAGFADSQNLAAESWGWEANIFLKERDYSKAIDYYLRQKGSYGAVVSLRMAAARALDHGDSDELETLAGNETVRKVVTSYLVCGLTGADYPTDQGTFNPMEVCLRRLSRWMRAIESAGAQDAFVAERLALAAYQLGDMTEARRWAEEAPQSITAQWLRAKLAFRHGDIEEAAKLLSKVAERVRDLDSDSTDLFSTLSSGWIPAREQVFAELGVFELHQKRFIEALDAFTKANSWDDAAFVAERILTLDELKSDVDAMEADAPAAKPLRELLARRYVRLNKMAEARPYFTTTNQEWLDQFTKNLEDGREASGEERARSYFAAARIMREHGMELMGTELEPDWVLREGTAEWEPAGAKRLKTPEDSLPPSEEEVRRIKATELAFAKRFRYRFIAAELGWLAAGSMPNNTDETARMLYEAGSWIKISDPAHANKFYKALVRRCRKTELGARADAKRWFPVLDETPRIEQKSPE